MTIPSLHRLQCREARPAGPVWNVVKTLSHMALWWVTFFFAIPAVLYHIEARIGLGSYRFASPLLREIGIVMFALFGVLGITSSLMMAVHGQGTLLPTDCARRLVIAGPYRYVRNPMGMAAILQGIAIALYLGSLCLLAYVLAGWMILEFFIRPWEESDLERRFGEPYRRYRRAVRCWVPNLRGYDAEQDHVS